MGAHSCWRPPVGALGQVGLGGGWSPRAFGPSRDEIEARGRTTLHRIRVV
jgi:hypothetical protein